MAVPTSISDCNATAANNSPAGSDSIGTSLDDYLRAHAAIIRQVYDALVVVDGTLLPKAGGTVTAQIKGITPVADEDLSAKRLRRFCCFCCHTLRLELILQQPHVGTEYTRFNCWSFSLARDVGNICNHVNWYNI